MSGNQGPGVYPWLWRHLPGPLPVRLLLAVLLVVAAVGALFVWGFPHLAPLMPFNDGTVSQ
jgi:hypothetical protein